MTRRKAAVFLWFDKDAVEAAKFYADTFPDSSIETEIKASVDVPGADPGDVQVVEMTICGIPYALMNGGRPQAPPNDTYSLQVYTGDQEETDRIWNAIVDNGGEAIMCGWCRDKWGYRWQITPRILMDALSHPDRDAAKRANEAMFQMQKIDIAAIEAAIAGKD